ncbi:hypothetical protein [Nocardiopsis sp. FR26]|uniref:hypothetical protein n=1 Tax=Nocardiopsis sp. FR26 TaxID=2605987 RepID=UPI0013587808|nr:hypothetical protein [Nocardiopsis sp. FR26]
MSPDRRRTVAVDFDGVIHTYEDGWRDGSVYGDLVPGAGAALELLMDTYTVFVHTSRDPAQVVPWLTEKWRSDRGYTVTADDHCRPCGGSAQAPSGDAPCPRCEGTGQARFWDEPGVLLVTQRKLPAWVYIDDRGLRFLSWGQALNQLDLLSRDVH